MCFTGECPAEDYAGECTALSLPGPLPCEVEEIFSEDAPTKGDTTP